jgi:DNA-binding CsgD family transcriptional regulator
VRFFREILKLWRKARGEKSVSLQMRLFAFFALLVFGLVSTFVLILMLTGVFGSGENEYRVWAENEMNHLTTAVSADFGKLSLQGTDYAGRLSSDIEAWLEENDASAATLDEHPELLEELLSDQASGLVTVMQNNNCTGAFMMLDATVNPVLPNAAYSKAGLFFKRTEQNMIGMVNSKLFYLRGPARISRETGIEMIGLWQMEFDVSAYDYYDIVMDMARKNNKLPLSRLYYWASRAPLGEPRESAMLLCVPLISSDGTVFGMCGFEVSPMLFKLLYSPDNSRYSRVFALLSPINKGVLDADLGLVASNSYVMEAELGKVSETSGQEDRPHTYESENGSLWVGLQSSVRLYPSGSPYEEETWGISVMLPEEDYKTSVTQIERVFYCAVIGLLLVSLLLAYFISKQYIRPIISTLNLITNEATDGTHKTRISEIDDLLEFLTAKDEDRKALESALEAQLQSGQDAKSQPTRDNGSPNLASYTEFKRNIETLSRAERSVFNLYMKGHNARDISEILSVSMNTIKTHNRHIYTKLCVTSRKELMQFVQMMYDENGKE